MPPVEEHQEKNASALQRMEAEINRFNQLYELFRAGLPKIQSAKGKDIVLVIGNMRSGKSTLINYLLGHKLVATEALVVDDRTGIEYPLPVVDIGEQVEGVGVAAIGHSTLSETLYPEVFSNLAEGNTNYCDCPGFEGNRGSIVRTVESITTQMAVNVSAGVKGLVVTVPYNEIENINPTSFNNLMLTLGNLFKAPEKVSRAITFAVTKAPANVSMMTIKGYVARLIQDLGTKHHDFLHQHRINNPDDVEALPKKIREELFTLEKSKAFANLFEQSIREDRCMTVDVLRESDRHALIERINASPGIPKKRFNFNKYDKTRMDLQDQIYSVLGVGLELLGNEKHNRQLIEEYRNQIRNRIDKMVNRQIEQNVQVGQRNRENNIREIENKRAELQNLRRKITQKRAVLSLLNSDRLEVYWRDSIHEKRSPLSLNWTVKRFRYDGIRHDEIVKECSRRGEFRDTREGTNAFSTRYVGGIGEDGYAKVQALVKRKNHPDNRRLIDRRINRIGALQVSIQEAEARIAELEAENRQYDQMQHATPEKREQIRQDIVNANTKKVQELETAIEALANETEEIQRVIREKTSVFETVMKLVFATGMGIESPLVKDFCEAFRLSHIQDQVGAEFTMPDFPILYKLGLGYQEMDGDGHCFYRALAHALGHEEDIEQLRKLVAAGLESDPEKYREFVTLAEGQTMEDYIAAVRNTNAWADHPEVTVMMHLLDRPIVVIDDNNRIINRHDFLEVEFAGNPIFLRRIEPVPEMGHFDYLPIREGFDAREILQSLLKTPQPTAEPQEDSEEGEGLAADAPEADAGIPVGQNVSDDDRGVDAWLDDVANGAIETAIGRIRESGGLMVPAKRAALINAIKQILTMAIHANVIEAGEESSALVESLAEALITKMTARSYPSPFRRSTISFDYKDREINVENAELVSLINNAIHQSAARPSPTV